MSQYYGIQGIPSNYLVDPNGIIVARNLRGDELTKKLEELLK
ncbi:TlpA family protein disulfide reductase [Pedobacter sp. NJ-S-72]